MSERTLTLFTLADFAPTKTAGRWLDERIGHLSASSLGMWRRCPEQWRNRYILGRKEPPGEGLVVGSFFHETLDWNYKQKIVSYEDRPLSELIEYLEDAAIPQVLDESGGPGEISWDAGDPAKGLEVGRSDARRIVGAYHHSVLPRIQPVATEQRMEWHIAGLPVPLIGYLDVIREGGVIDTKTGKQAPKKLKPSWQLQADIYSAYTGLEIEYHTINRSATPTINTPLEYPELAVRTTQPEMQNLVGTIVRMAEQIEWMFQTYGPDEPWPTLGRWADWSMSTSPCSYCGFRAAKGGYPPCPAWA